MSSFQACQLALASVALVLIAWRLSSLLGRASLDAAAFSRALAEDLRAGRTSAALRVAHALRPAAAAVLACAVLDELQQDGDARGMLEQMHAELRLQALAGRDEILTLGRLASPLALIGVILELGPSGGMLQRAGAWQRDALVSGALGRAAFAFALGLATLCVCGAAAALITRRGRAVVRDLDRVAALFDAREGDVSSDPM